MKPWHAKKKEKEKLVLSTLTSTLGLGRKEVAESNCKMV
jgi:hypothetical protein